MRQAYPKGLGDAIYQAKSFIGEEPIVVMLGDNIMESDVPVTKQLMDLYEENGASNKAVKCQQRVITLCSIMCIVCCLFLMTKGIRMGRI